MYLYICVCVCVCVCVYIYNISCSTSLPNNSCVDGFTSIYFYFYGSNHHLKELGWLSSTKLYGNVDFFITITLFF